MELNSTDFFSKENNIQTFQRSIGYVFTSIQIEEYQLRE